MSLFYYFNFEQNYEVSKSKSLCILFNKNINFNKNETIFDSLSKWFLWIRTRPIFVKFDRTHLIQQKCVKSCCLQHLFDSINWPCINISFYLSITEPNYCNIWLSGQNSNFPAACSLSVLPLFVIFKNQSNFPQFSAH